VAAFQIEGTDIMYTSSNMRRNMVAFVKGGTTVIAFVTDPDGYKIELISMATRT